MKDPMKPRDKITQKMSRDADLPVFSRAKSLAERHKKTRVNP